MRACAGSKVYGAASRRQGNGAAMRGAFSALAGMISTAAWRSCILVKAGERLPDCFCSVSLGELRPSVSEVPGVRARGASGRVGPQ
jgi:hypothetical protein